VPQLLLRDVFQPDDDLPERLLPAALFGEGCRELLGGQGLRLDQELAELGVALVAFEHRQELAPGDDFLRDEDVAEGTQHS